MNQFDKKSQAWSALFSEPMSDLVKRYTSSVFFDKRLWLADITGSLAHAEMLCGQGIISVASNLIPGPVAKLAKLARTKQFAEAKVLHDQLADIFKTLFVEPNPVPVKHCMMRAGIIRSDEVRLPLCEMSEANRLLVEKVADATLASLR